MTKEFQSQIPTAWTIEPSTFSGLVFSLCRFANSSCKVNKEEFKKTKLIISDG
jgi:hypothetical protein